MPVKEASPTSAPIAAPKDASTSSTTNAEPKKIVRTAQAKKVEKPAPASFFAPRPKPTVAADAKGKGKEVAPEEPDEETADKGEDEDEDEDEDESDDEEEGTTTKLWALPIRFSWPKADFAAFQRRNLHQGICSPVHNGQVGGRCARPVRCAHGDVRRDQPDDQAPRDLGPPHHFSCRGH